MHYCPDCYAICRCGGDIDDLVLGENLACTHYQECEADYDEEYENDE